MSTENTIRGSCLCGAVRVIVNSASDRVGACHCSMCRNWGGGPLLTVEGGSDVRLEGTEHVTVFDSSDWAERGFCNKCGSHLFYRLKKEGEYGIPVGLLEDARQWRFDHQIFIEEKPPFYTFANETQNLTGAEAFAQYAPPSG